MSFFIIYQSKINAGKTKDVANKKKHGQLMWLAIHPLLDDNISLVRLIKEESRAYCVAVYATLHKDDRYATNAVVAIPPARLSAQIVAPNI